MADNLNITAGSGTTVATDQVGSDHYQKVKLADGTADSSTMIGDGSGRVPVAGAAADGAAVAGNPVLIAGSDGTNAQSIAVNTEGAIKIYDIVNGTVGVENITRVRNLVDGTLSLVTRVDRVFNLIDGTITLLTRADRVMNLIDGTLSTVTGVDRIRNIVDGTISTVDTITRVNRVFNLVDGTITFIPVVQRVQNLVDGTLTTVSNLTDGNLTRLRNLIDGTISFIPVVQRVQNVVDGTLTTVTGVDRVRNIIDGTISTVDTAIRVNRVFNIVDGTISLDNIQSTARICTVSSSMTGSYPSGQTIVAPSANYSFKVFAISITTTAQTQNVVTLMNGGGTPTEFWRVALQAPTAGIAGANLAVSPPGYIFATGTSTTLAIRADAGSLIHYSVSYRKESA